MTSMPLAGNPQQSGTTTEAPPSSLLTKPELAPGVPNPIYLAAMEQKKREWASWVESQYSACKMARASFDRQWYLNLAFVSGKQYVAPLDVPGIGFRLTSPKAPPFRVRLVVNKIRTAVRTECSKLTSSKPIPTVVPATSEDEDFTAARVAESLLRNFFATAEFEKTYRSFIWWGVVTGTSYLKSYWSATEEDYDAMTPPAPPVGPDGQPLPPEMLEMLETKIPGLKEHYETPVPAKGKIMVERVNPFHIYVPDLLTEDINKQPYVIHVTTRNPLYIKKQFGINAVPDARAASTIMDSATVISKGGEEVLDSVLVKEIWLRENAHPDFPKGGVITVVNNQCVQVKEEWPWPFREYPFYKYDGIPTGGFYSDSVVVDLIPIQKEYNRSRSQMIEIKNTMGKPKLLYQKGSINPRQISSDPGQSIPYTAGFSPPIVIPGAEVPQSMVNELDILSNDFDDLSGQHEITRGNTPAQVTSGTAIAFLQEQDDSKLSFQVSGIEYCMEILGKHFLKYVATYWDDARLIRVTGKDSTFEAVQWKGSDLRGNTDVKVQTGSALPVSKAAKQAMVTEFMQLGFISPEAGMEMLDLGGYEKILEDLLIDKRQAQRENMKMAQMDEALLQQVLSPPVGPDGQPMIGPDGVTPVMEDGITPFQPQSPIPVNSWDNHEAHIHFHNQFRKTQQFELLGEFAKQAFELHVQTHQMAIVLPQMGAGGNVVANEQPPTEPGMEGEETEDEGQPPPDQMPQ